MMILDTVMDALSSVFPHLTREPPSGDVRSGAGNESPSGEAHGQPSFAATLLHLLGGSRTGEFLSAEKEAGTETDASRDSTGAEEVDSAGSEEAELSGAEWVQTMGGEEPETTGAAKPETTDEGEAEPTGDGSVARESRAPRGAVGGGRLAGRSAMHASETGLRERMEHGVPFSGRVPSQEGDPVEGEAPHSGPGIRMGAESGLAAEPGEGFHSPRRPAPEVDSDSDMFEGKGQASATRAHGKTEVRAPSGTSPMVSAAHSDGAPRGPGEERVEVGEDGSGETSEARRVGGEGGSPVRESSAPAEVHRVTRDLDLLEPDFRQRLDQVIQRMRQEFGHRVEVTETYRSPQRQEALYAQGRSEPGRVVTWTNHSLHSQGRAADVRIDGSWENPQGYARLQRIAQEEGLQTLGPKDPGHLELPHGGAETTSRGSTFGVEDRSQREISQRGVTARVARPAQVSSPASAARRSRVASVARSPRAGSMAARTLSPQADPVSPEQPGAARTPGESGPAAPHLSSAARVSADRPASHRLPEAAGPEAGHPPVRGVEAGSSSFDEAPRRSASEMGSVEAPAPALGKADAPSPESAMAFQVPNTNGGTPVSGLQGPGASGTSGIMGRVDEIQALEEAMSARAPGRIHLELENADGAGTRLRLALRGSQLAGTVDLSDPVATERMRARVGELHEALTRRGLDAQSLKVQGVRGMESGGGAQMDLASLLQDPLAGLARVMDAREGGPEYRQERGSQGKDQEREEAERFGQNTRQNRKKEDQR